MGALSLLYLAMLLMAKWAYEIEKQAVVCGILGSVTVYVGHVMHFLPVLVDLNYDSGSLHLYTSATRYGFVHIYTTMCVLVPSSLVYNLLHTLRDLAWRDSGGCDGRSAGAVFGASLIFFSSGFRDV